MNPTSTNQSPTQPTAPATSQPFNNGQPLTPQQVDQMRQQAGITSVSKPVVQPSTQNVQTRLDALKSGGYGTPGASPSQPQQPGFLSRIGQDFNNAKQGIVDSITHGGATIAKGGPVNFVRGAAEGALGAAGNTVGAVFAPLNEGIKSVVPQTGNEWVDSATQGAGNGAVLGGPWGALLGSIAGLGFHGVDKVEQFLQQNSHTAQFFKDNPDVLRDFNNGLNVLTAVLGEKKLGETTPAGKPDIMNTPLSEVPGRVKQNLVDTANATHVPEAAKTLVMAPIEKGKQLLDSTKTYLSGKNVEPQLATSANRLATPPVQPGTEATPGQPASQTPLDQQGAVAPKAQTPVQTYDKFYAQEQKFKGDIKQDPALSQVGERTGKAYDQVVKMRRDVGKVIGDEMSKIGNTPMDTSKEIQAFRDQLAQSGVDYNPQIGKVSVADNAKVASQDAKILQKYGEQLTLLGSNPTAQAVDAFLSRMPQEIDLYKSKNNITTVTNGERLIKNNLAQMRNLFDPQVDPQTGTAARPEFQKYFKAKSDYSNLTNFLDEGSSFLGKKTQSGDYAKDASLAKSSVQSILNNGKKDWLAQLEGLTGYPALDESVLALQAMKDAGNFRGLSLLQTLSEGNVPLTKSGIIHKVLDLGLDKAKTAIVGSPNEQTRTFLQSLTPQEGSLTPSLDKVKNYVQEHGIGLSTKNVSKKIHPEDAATMQDFIDYVDGSYRPDDKTVFNLSEDAQRIMEHYGINGQQWKNGTIANKFEQILADKNNIQATPTDKPASTKRSGGNPYPREPGSKIGYKPKKK